jgi:hypothetical protein
VTVSGPGCHDDSFFAAQQPPALAFLAAHLAPPVRREGKGPLVLHPGSITGTPGFLGRAL